MSRPLQRKPIYLFPTRRKSRAKRLPSLRFDITPSHYVNLPPALPLPPVATNLPPTSAAQSLPIRPLEGAPREEQQGRLAPPLPHLPARAELPEMRTLPHPLFSR